MENLLFKSDGSPVKRKKSMNMLADIEIALGVFVLLVSTQVYGSVRKFSLFLGVAAIVVGLIVKITSKRDYTKKSKLYLYETYMEGAQASPFVEFKLKYNEIEEVEKTVLFSNPMLLIVSGKDKFVVLVDDINTAYEIICDKVYGG